MTPEHTFGGSRMDRHIVDFEVSEGGDLGGGEMGAVAALNFSNAPDADPGDAQPEPVEAAAAVEPETAPAEVAPAWSSDDPAFQEAVQLQAAEVARQELAQFFEQFEGQQQGQQPLEQGEPIDPSEYLNPMSDEFGGNLMQVLSNMFQTLEQRTQQMYAPVQRRYESETLAEGQQRVQDVIADDFSRNGDISLPDDSGVKVNDVIKDIAPLYLGEMEQRFGKGTARAAEQAIAKASGLVRQIVSAAEKSGASKNANELSTLAGARTEPGTQGGGLSVAPPAGDEMAIARFHSNRHVAA